MLNKVELIGNLTADPKISETKDGKKIARISIATSEYYKDGNGDKQQRTEFHNCSAFGKLAEIIENYTSKGKRVYISGKLTYSKKEVEGVTTYYTQVLINEVLLLSNKDKEEVEKKEKKVLDEVPDWEIEF